MQEKLENAIVCTLSFCLFFPGATSSFYYLSIVKLCYYLFIVQKFVQYIHKCNYNGKPLFSIKEMVKWTHKVEVQNLAQNNASFDRSTLEILSHFENELLGLRFFSLLLQTLGSI